MLYKSELNCSANCNSLVFTTSRLSTEINFF